MPATLNGLYLELELQDKMGVNTTMYNWKTGGILTRLYVTIIILNLKSMLVDGVKMVRGLVHYYSTFILFNDIR